MCEDWIRGIWEIRRNQASWSEENDGWIMWFSMVSSYCPVLFSIVSRIRINSTMLANAAVITVNVVVQYECDNI